MVKKILSISALLSLVLISFFSVTQVAAQENLVVSEFAIATSIEDRTPRGVSDTFPTTVSKLYAYTKINGAMGETTINHRWYYGETLLAEVSLDVRSASWRTYSSKNILPQWPGQWKVEVTNAQGTVLDSLQFTIE